MDLRKLEIRGKEGQEGSKLLANSKWNAGAGAHGTGGKNRGTNRKNQMIRM